MTLTASIAQIRALGPCSGGYRFALTGLPKEGEITAAQARAFGCSLEDVSWYLSKQATRDPEIDRRLRHWKADVAAHVLHVFEAAYPGDFRPRRAIEIAHAVADGHVEWAFFATSSADAKLIEDAAFDAGNPRAGQAAAAARICGDDLPGGRASWTVCRCAVEAVRENREVELEWQYSKLVEWFTGDGPGPLALEVLP